MDFNVVDVPAMLAQKVTISDEYGERADPDWNREFAESQYVFAEFLFAKNLISSDLEVSRTPNLIVRWSDLNSIGQAFVKTHYHKWLTSIDKSGTTEFQMQDQLSKRWVKFTASNQ